MKLKSIVHVSSSWKSYNLYLYKEPCSNLACFTEVTTIKTEHMTNLLKLVDWITFMGYEITWVNSCYFVEIVTHWINVLDKLQRNILVLFIHLSILLGEHIFDRFHCRHNRLAVNMLKVFVLCILVV
jgi:hypothetical protein